MKKRYLVIFLAFIISGCASASFTQTGETFPKHEGPVRVLAEVPDGIEFVEIGIVSSKGGMIHSDADVIKAMQKRAARSGANAILLMSSREFQQWHPEYGSMGTGKEMTAMAIRIKNQ